MWSGTLLGNVFSQNKKRWRDTSLFFNQTLFYLHGLPASGAATCKCEGACLHSQFKYTEDGGETLKRALSSRFLDDVIELLNKPWFPGFLLYELINILIAEPDFVGYAITKLILADINTS